MVAVQARQKSYANKRRKPIEFEVGDHVYLKVSPMKGVKHFGVKRKLASRYVGPYQILERSGKVAYKLQLPPELGTIFLVFHVSQLKKCLRVPEERVEVRCIKLKADLAYEEKPVIVLEVKERVTQNHVVKLYKVVWSNHNERDATWEREDYLRDDYSKFFNEWYAFQILGRDFYKGGRAITPQCYGCTKALASHEHVHYHLIHKHHIMMKVIISCLVYL
jgi:hypothetical protein